MQKKTSDRSYVFADTLNSLEPCLIFIVCFVYFSTPSFVEWTIEIYELDKINTKTYIVNLLYWIIWLTISRF